MNGLHTLQALMGGQGSAQTGQAGGQTGLKDLENPENRAFLETLLETEGLAGSGMTLEDLQALLAGDVGNSLPPLAAAGQAMPLLQPLQDQNQQAQGINPGLNPGLNQGLGQDMPRQAAAGKQELRQDMLRGGLGSQAGQDGDKLAARLALMDQLQMKRVLSNQAQASGGGVRQEPDAASLLQSYTQTSQSLDAPPRGASPMPSFTVGTPMDQNGWGQAMGERLVMLAKQDVQQARLQLNPRELGPVQVSILVKDDAATLTFTAMHAVTREALDAELPRLRQMLQDNGFDDVTITVNQEDNRGLAGRNGEDQDGKEGRSGLSDDDSAEQDSGTGTAEGSRHVGLIDHYA